MKKVPHTKGYSLVEVLVAVTILMFSIVGPITIAAKSMQSALYAKQQNTAFFLAQEGISAINTLRNEAGIVKFRTPASDPWAWTRHAALAPCYAAAGCNIDFRDGSLLNNIVNCASSATTCNLRFGGTSGRAVYRVSGAGEVSPYKRTINLTRVGDEVRVQSKVEWSSPILGGTQNVTMNTSLFNTYK